jgi:hypothetical protein
VLPSISCFHFESPSFVKTKKEEKKKEKGNKEKKRNNKEKKYLKNQNHY